MRKRYDILWKGMLEEVIEDLLRFVQPDIEKYLDLSRGIEFMDKELAAIYPEPDKVSHTRVLDKLVKVFTRDGDQKWILLHIEIQGATDPEFAKRMFQYYYRVFDWHDRPVAAIAVLTGKGGKNMPDKYDQRYLWMRQLYQYKTIRITDYTDEELAASDNPFAVVMLVAKEALLKLKGTEDERDAILLKQKMLIVRLLKKKAFSEEKIRALYVFLNNYLPFKKPETYRTFVEQVDKETGKKNTMGILEQLAEIKAEEALEKGIKKGIRKGRQEGERKVQERAVKVLLANTEFSVEKIASLIGVTVSFVERVKAKL